jgi:hypothetical protein
VAAGLVGFPVALRSTELVSSAMHTLESGDFVSLAITNMSMRAPPLDDNCKDFWLRL